MKMLENMRNWAEVSLENLLDNPNYKFVAPILANLLSKIKLEEGKPSDAEKKERVHDLEKAINHIKKRFGFLNLEATNCVDDGTTEKQARFGHNRPGAHAGLGLGLLGLSNSLGLNIEPKKIHNLTKKFVTEILKAPFEWHTDDHHGNDCNSEFPCAGCGHMAKAGSAQWAEMYGVTPEQVQALAGNLNHNADNEQRTILSRNHNAQGAIIIHGARYTVNAWSGEKGDTQFFVYNIDHDMDIVRLFAEFLQGEGYEQVTYELLWSMIEQQNNATFSILAEDAPVYHAHFGDEAVQIAEDSDKESIVENVSHRDYEGKTMIAVVPGGFIPSPDELKAA